MVLTIYYYNGVCNARKLKRGVRSIHTTSPARSNTVHGKRQHSKRKVQVDYNLLQFIICTRDISCFNSRLTSVTKIVHTPWMSSNIEVTICLKRVLGELMQEERHQDQGRPDSIQARYGSIRSGRTGDQEKDKAHTKKENQPLPTRG